MNDNNSNLKPCTMWPDIHTAGNRFKLEIPNKTTLELLVLFSEVFDQAVNVFLAKVSLKSGFTSNRLVRSPFPCLCGSVLLISKLFYRLRFKEKRLMETGGFEWV